MPANRGHVSFGEQATAGSGMNLLHGRSWAGGRERRRPELRSFGTWIGRYCAVGSSAVTEDNVMASAGGLSRFIVSGRGDYHGEEPAHSGPEGRQLPNLAAARATATPA